MNAQLDRVTFITYASALTLAFAAWSIGAYFLTVVVILSGAGIAMAKPCVRERRLVLNGTPVVLMLAVMFISASGMVFAVDQMNALLDDQDAVEAPATECDSVAADNGWVVVLAD